MIEEAFEEDDVWGEHEKEAEDKRKAELAVLDMPGFGTGWAGEGITQKKKKAKVRLLRFL